MIAASLDDTIEDEIGQLSHEITKVSRLIKVIDD